MRKISIGLLFFLIALVPGTTFSQLKISSTPWVTPELSQEQRKYFLALYRDSWNYLSYAVEEMTALPYDSSQKQPVISMSNIGLYLASTAIAYRTGLISYRRCP